MFNIVNNKRKTNTNHYINGIMRFIKDLVNIREFMLT
jgi:hypothetical protein